MKCTFKLNRDIEYDFDYISLIQIVINLPNYQEIIHKNTEFRWKFNFESKSPFGLIIYRFSIVTSSVFLNIFLTFP